MIIERIKREIKLSKKGNPYQRVSIAVDTYKDGTGKHRWISGFGNSETEMWNVGTHIDEGEIKIKERNGYLNFEFPQGVGKPLNLYQKPATIGFVLELLKQRPQAGQNTSPEPQNAPQTADEIPF